MELSGRELEEFQKLVGDSTTTVQIDVIGNRTDMAYKIK
jgi:hypothetical protein